MGQHKGSPCSALGQVVESRSSEVLGDSLAKMDHTQSPEDKQLSLELSRGYFFFFFSLYSFANQERTENAKALTDAILH